MAGFVTWRFIMIFSPSRISFDEAARPCKLRCNNNDGNQAFFSFRSFFFFCNNRSILYRSLGGQFLQRFSAGLFHLFVHNCILSNCRRQCAGYLKTNRAKPIKEPELENIDCPPIVREMTKVIINLQRTRIVI